MRKNKILILPVILVLLLCFTSNAGAVDNTTVDPAWMEKAINTQGDDKHPPAELVYEFALAHPSEVLPASKSAYMTKDYNPYLNITTINLDEDKEPEHIMFIGQNYANTMFYVIKKVNNQWKIIHSEYLWLHNEAPELHLSNTTLKNRTFHIRYLHERGTGLWLYTYRFYKVINGKTYLTLEIPEEVNLAMYASLINGDASLTKIQVDSNDDSIYAHYSYEFWPGGQIMSALHIEEPSEGEPMLLLKQENAFVSFDWNDKKHKFEVSEPSGNAEADTITLAQFNYFLNLLKIDNDKLFVPAFKKQLEEVTTSGDEQQKKIAKYLLSHTKTKK